MDTQIGSNQERALPVKPMPERMERTESNTAGKSSKDWAAAWAISVQWPLLKPDEFGSRRSFFFFLQEPNNLLLSMFFGRMETRR